MSPSPTPLLLSRENPDGWRLEDLFRQIRYELHEKNDRIAADTSPTAIAVTRNNHGIIDLLELAEARQRHTLTRLEALGADPGPGGTPRIGAGSSPAEG